jgi:LemA protein
MSYFLLPLIGGLLMTLFIIIGALVVGLLFYGILIFNLLVSLKNNVLKNWSNIDVLLKQRNSELPKLIETCQQYMEFEQDTLQKIVIARQSAVTAYQMNNLKAINTTETELRSLLGKLFALTENYPDLKTNQTFLQLQTRISDLENAIADRREFYNDSANIYNTRINQFPDLIMARLFNFVHYTLLTFDSEEIKDIDIKAAFKKRIQ